ncbi:hypothetical protein [Gimesia fumaroli]|uniref:Uncharacterized protein n=1 Tax=Gimesia fumaroli TaxID=2527976 RepID=A0A518I5N1_9PLAN|nr:hypothetical protein [Gimesia fumaroli]QDV48409.1 hypothetical protein Enr17x_04210 [Gimesia fumaroli]
MKKSDIPNLTEEQQHALDEGEGVVQGASFILMRTDVVLDWFGYSEEDLRRRLQPGLDQIETGDVAEWSLDDFLAEMHKQRASETS